MTRKRKMARRAWLNTDKHMTGSVAYDINGWSGGYCNSLDLRDCTRAITLEFSWDFSEPQKKNRAMKKLRNFIEFLEDFEQKMMALPGEKPKQKKK
jgi:hypothetical protein